ncbi:cold shock domain-containing protein [Sphingomonas sp. LY160]|uniref:cold-shock protein n=1 Tax=Sphingomonas sp. LY160 TaxID=3095342 RepID=UPI002ADEB832|nr:cold shock domain-containing protein [Sphingomonas sp. LY160]MEA1073114.1 cold shock domain-containing protein [Sphingomonas sp. LY160]
MNMSEPQLASELPLPEGQHCSGRVKWFDATRGFGFLISEDCEGDILIHFSLLKEHDRRSVPEGATIECIAAHQDRGFQALKILSIDLSTALPMAVAPVHATVERADRKALADTAGEYEPVEVKWFNRVKGYGFLCKPGESESGEDIFVHMETVRLSHIIDLEPGQLLEARVASGKKGLTAVELRLAG